MFLPSIQVWRSGPLARTTATSTGTHLVRSGFRLALNRHSVTPDRGGNHCRLHSVPYDFYAVEPAAARPPFGGELEPAICRRGKGAGGRNGVRKGAEHARARALEAGASAIPVICSRRPCGVAQESEEARALEAGFLASRVCLGKGQYADLSHLLPLLTAGQRWNPVYRLFLFVVGQPRSLYHKVANSATIWSLFSTCR
jgi:hypothetical protein